MVGETFHFVDRNFNGLASNLRRSDLIINAPAYVLSPSLSPIGPPCVLIWFLVDLPEYIDKLEFVENFGKPGTLFWQKARILLIGSPFFQIDLLMGNIPVTT